MADINKLKDKIKSTIYPNGKGAINASDHQAMLLDMADGMAETDTKLAELSEEVGGIGRAIADTMTNSNAFDKLAIIEGGQYTYNGNWLSHPSFVSSDFIPIKPGDSVKITFIPVSSDPLQTAWTTFKSDKATFAGIGQANIPMDVGLYEFVIPPSYNEVEYFTFGLNHDINLNSVVVTINNQSEYKVKFESVEGLRDALNDKQDTLIAGENIILQGNTISTKTGVFVNELQNLSETQKTTARTNIGAASEEDVIYIGAAERNVTEGFANWLFGYVRPNGTIVTATGGTWRYSDKIPIVPDSPIVVNRLYCNSAVASVAAYDTNDSLIAECSLSQDTSVFPESPVTIQTAGKGVAYIRITVGGGFPEYDVIATQYSRTTIKEVISRIQAANDNLGEQWNGKSWVAIGTSITDTNNTLDPNGGPTGKFPPYLIELSGLTITNKGVAGAVLGGHILYYAGYTAQMATAKLVTIEGGVNDWADNRPLGNVGDIVPYLIEWTSPVWNNGGSADGTFAGACYQAIKTAMENAPKAVIVVVTDNTGQHITSTGADCSREKKNTLGLTQYDYTNMLVEVAKYMGVPVINAGQKSLINQDNPEYLIDQIHQTELGGKQYATVIWQELKMLPCRVTDVVA